MVTSKKVLFIGNDTGRTGAPIILLEIARYFKSRGYETRFVFEGEGVLNKDYRELGPVWFWRKNLNGISIKPLRYACKLLWLLGLGFLYRTYWTISLRLWKPDIVYGNTGVSGYLIAHLNIKNANTVMHVHEMATILKKHCGLRFTKGISYVERYIAVNSIIADLLVRDYGIDANKIQVIPEFVTSPIRLEKYEQGERFLIGGCGVPGKRKGFGYFIAIIDELINNRKMKDVFFQWIGFDRENMENQVYLNEIERLGIGEYFSLIPQTSDPLSYFAKFSCFMLTSVEDPNPLVVLEAGLLGKPVLSFKESGATDDIVDKGGGDYAPMGDCKAMAELVLSYYRDKEMMQRKGEKIRSIVTNDYSKERNLEAIYDLSTR